MNSLSTPQRSPADAYLLSVCLLSLSGTLLKTLGAPLQCIAGIVILFVVHLLHGNLHPYNDEQLNSSEAYSLVVLLFTLVGGLALDAPPATMDKGVVEIFKSFLAIVIFTVNVVFFIYMVRALIQRSPKIQEPLRQASVAVKHASKRLSMTLHLDALRHIHHHHSDQSPSAVTVADVSSRSSVNVSSDMPAIGEGEEGTEGDSGNGAGDGITRTGCKVCMAVGECAHTGGGGRLASSSAEGKLGKLRQSRSSGTKKKLSPMHGDNDDGLELGIVGSAGSCKAHDYASAKDQDQGISYDVFNRNMLETLSFAHENPLNRAKSTELNRAVSTDSVDFSEGQRRAGHRSQRQTGKEAAQVRTRKKRIDWSPSSVNATAKGGETSTLGAELGAAREGGEVRIVAGDDHPAPRDTSEPGGDQQQQQQQQQQQPRSGRMVHHSSSRVQHQEDDFEL